MKKSLLLITLLFVLISSYALPQSASAQEPFIGEIRLFAGNFAPRGWAFCNGQLVPISEYPALYSILGTFYGGDGRATFALPDLRGRVPISAGQGPGLTNRRLGQRGGQENVTLGVAQMPAHTHQAVASNNPADAVSPAGNVWGATSRTRLYSPAGSPANMAPGAISQTGANAAHENMPPFVTLHYIIAIQGLYPSPN